MGRITAKLKELRNVDVAIVSLVDRAASRMPIRILKRDKDPQMIDLSGIGRTLKRAVQKHEPPAIAGFIVLDNPDPVFMENVQKAVKDHGFSIEHVTKHDDGTVVFAQDDQPVEGTLLRLSDQLLVVMKGFDQYSEDLRENADFNELVAANGFFAGLAGAIQALYSTICAALEDADSPMDAGPDVKDALGKFSGYVQTLVSSLPSNAFKLDHVLQDLARKAAEAKNSPIDLKKIPTTCPKGISQNDWDALDDTAKLKWVADSTNSPAPGTTQKADMKKIDSNTMLEIEELMKQPPLGSDGTKWVSMSLGDKVEAWKASFVNANNQGAQDGKNGTQGGVQIDVSNPTAKAPSVKAGDKGAVTDPTQGGTTAVKADNGDDDDDGPEKPEDMSPEDWDALSDEDKMKASKRDHRRKRDAALTAVVSSVAALAQQVTGLTTKFDEQVKAMTTKIDDAARKSDDALAKIKSVVPAAPPADDRPANGGGKTPARKADDDPRSGAFDTAFLPNRGRR
jgi:hypothetical protein